MHSHECLQRHTSSVDALGLTGIEVELVRLSFLPVSRSLLSSGLLAQGKLGCKGPGKERKHFPFLLSVLTGQPEMVGSFHCPLLPFSAPCC